MRKCLCTGKCFVVCHAVENCVVTAYRVFLKGEFRL